MGGCWNEKEEWFRRCLDIVGFGVVFREVRKCGSVRGSVHL
jgi:hypothetical protein